MAQLPPPPPPELARALIRVYEAAERELLARIKLAAQDDAAYMREDYRGDGLDPWALRQRRAVVGIIARLERNTQPALRQLVRGSWRWGTELFRPAAQRVSRRDIVDGTAEISLIDQEAVQALIRSEQQRLSQVNAALGDRTMQILYAIQERAVAESIVLNETPDERAERIRQRLIAAEEKGLVTFAEGRGKTEGMRLLPRECSDGVTRHYRLAPYAELVSQTLMTHAETEAVQAKGRQGAYNGVQISEHQHREEDHDECKPWEGTKWGLVPGTPYPIFTVAAKTPYHARCKHRTLPRHWDAQGRNVLLSV